MIISIKNVKFSAFASQETYCFEATVYVDGKREFIASNDGQGGCNQYHNIKPVNFKANDVYTKVKEIVRRLAEESDEIIDIMNANEGYSGSLEIVIGELLNTWLARKDAKRILKKVCMVYKGHLHTFNISNAKFKADAARLTDAILKNHPNADILNKYTFDVAFEKMDGLI